MDETQLERLFPQVENLLQVHQLFLDRLKQRRIDSLEPGSTQNYCIHNIGDILIAQFSGEIRDRLQYCYGVFCSHHTDAVNFYKDLMQNNKKFQNLIRKICQLSIMRRLGIPEIILLITQRITKYPVLYERVIKYTEVDSEEHRDLVRGLELLKDTISQVNSQVDKSEKAVRLRDLSSRLEPKSQDGKPAVISLQKLIIRDVAHDEKALFLISASSETPEMYEFHTSSGEERKTWRDQIWKAVEHCPEEEDEPEKLPERIQDYQRYLCMRDALIEQLLLDKLKLFSSISAYVTGVNDISPSERRLLRGNAAEPMQGEELLAGALKDVEILQTLLVTCEPGQTPSSGEGMDLVPLSKRPDAFTGFNSDNACMLPGNGIGSLIERMRDRSQWANLDPQLRELYSDENLELSADEEITPQSWNAFPLVFLPKAELYHTVTNLSQKLYSLQIPPPYPLLKVVNPGFDERPPLVPPRRESIANLSVKPEVPIHLISTTNQSQKAGSVQQTIPTKLAAHPKSKDKHSKQKSSHQRTKSAAGIEVSQILPIKVTGKEGGSLRAMRSNSPHQLRPDMFIPPEKLSGSVPSNSGNGIRKRNHSHNHNTLSTQPVHPKAKDKTTAEDILFF
ncbi:rho guanine nucleotide exchange factor 18-like protein [Labeo rohita]|uniref:Rho guanine nucleotide exchange factor 18-like protein n=1 Tax=Labeo rohita TaxID=84645 RepID=A0A498LT62_LABRO|nr:rho guanine nucleotide exchange factor 18-like protein [Labeo rohita]